MTVPDEPGTDAIERRLARVAGTGPVPALRRRVLAAVDDVLRERRTRAAAGGEEAARGQAGSWARTRAWTGMVAWSAAAALGFALALPWLAIASHAGRVEPFSIARRLEAAGVMDETIVASLAATPPTTAVANPGRAAAPAALRPMVRVLDGRRLFAENL